MRIRQPDSGAGASNTVKQVALNNPLCESHLWLCWVETASGPFLENDFHPLKLGKSVFLSISWNGSKVGTNCSPTRALRQHKSLKLHPLSQVSLHGLSGEEPFKGAHENPVRPSISPKSLWEGLAPWLLIIELSSFPYLDVARGHGQEQGMAHSEHAPTCHKRYHAATNDCIFDSWEKSRQRQYNLWFAAREN